MREEKVIVRGKGKIFMEGKNMVKDEKGEVVREEDIGGGDVKKRI